MRRNAILNPVDQFLRVLHPDPNRKRLCVQPYSTAHQHAVSVPGAMPGAKNQSIALLFIPVVQHHAAEPVVP